MNRFFKLLSTDFERLLLFLHKRRTGLIIGAEVLTISALLLLWWNGTGSTASSSPSASKNPFSILRQNEEEEKKEFIKWVDFKVPSEAMTQAFRYDVGTCQNDIHLDWIDLLAYLGGKYGGDFSHYSPSDMDKLATRLKEGTSLDELTKDMKYFTYYREAYGAVLGGMVGYYEIEIPASEAPSFALSDTQINEGDPAAAQNGNAAQNSSETQNDGPVP